MNKWHKVKEQPPEGIELELCENEDGKTARVYLGKWSILRGYTSFWGGEPTHWRIFLGPEEEK